jgi:uncharacterized protein (DUF885 family)
VKLNIRNIFRILSGLIFVAIVVFLVRLIWFKPNDINSFLLRIFVEQLAQDNEKLTQIRPPFLDNFSGYDADFTPLTQAYQESQQNLIRQQLETLESYPYERLEAHDRIAYDVVHYWLQREEEENRYARFSSPFNPVDGVQIRLPQVMVDYHPILDQEASDDYVSRLRHFPRQFRASQQTTENGSPHNQLAAYLLRRSIRQTQAWTQMPLETNPLYIHYARKARQRIASHPTELNELTASDYLGRIVEAWENEGLSAYQNLDTYLNQQLGQATEAAGLHQQEGGLEYYRWCMLNYTESEQTPQAQFQAVEEQFSQIQRRLNRWLDTLEVEPGPTGERLQKLFANSLPDTNWINTRQYQKDFRILSVQNQQYVSGLINEHDPIALVIRERTSLPHAYPPVFSYEPPALDESRSAQILLHPDQLAVFPREMHAIWIWHHAWPGTHLARSVSWRNEELEGYRQILEFPAFREGWQWYAAELMDKELYLLEPDMRVKVAFWQWRLFHLAAAMADYEIHHGERDLPTLADWLQNECGMPEPMVEQVLGQILVYPARSFARFQGYQRIMQIRNRAQEKLGEAFFLQDFHDELLKHGEVPLDVLGKLMETWIQQKLAS